MITNQMSFQEIANELEKLGIADISKETIKKLEDFWADTPEEFTQDLYKTPLLLTSIGGGSYDYDNHTWTPTSSQVYSFDIEVFDIGQMYTMFMQGISAISGGEFKITHVMEDTSNVDFAEGTGTQIIHFFQFYNLLQNLSVLTALPKKKGYLLTQNLQPHSDAAASVLTSMPQDYGIIVGTYYS